MRKPLLRTLALSALLFLGGCAALNEVLAASFQKPTLTFQRADLADVSLGGATVNLTYVVENPNPLGLSLAEVSYAFSVEGKQVVAGTPPSGLTLPANGRANLVFPASVKFQELAPALVTFLNKDKANYRAEGSIGIQTPIGILRLPLVKEGTFDVPKLPQVKVGQPQVTGVSFTGAQVNLPLVVTNKNAFALPIGGVDGAIQLGSASVGTVSTGDLGAIDAQGTRQVTLPLRLRFDNAATALTSLVGRPVTLGFRGSLKSGPISLPLDFSQTVTLQK